MKGKIMPLTRRSFLKAVGITCLTPSLPLLKPVTFMPNEAQKIFTPEILRKACYNASGKTIPEGAAMFYHKKRMAGVIFGYGQQWVGQEGYHWVTPEELFINRMKCLST